MKRYETPQGKKKTHKLPLGITVIGRSESSGITLEDKQVPFLLFPYLFYSSLHLFTCPLYFPLFFASF